MFTPKPIETCYRGHRFRSRLEARWAVFFDQSGVSYWYEKEGYELDGERYLPDFWIPFNPQSLCPSEIRDNPPGSGYWVEIKPIELSEREDRLLTKLVVATGHHAFALIGQVRPGKFEVVKDGLNYKKGTIEYYRPTRKELQTISPAEGTAMIHLLHSNSIIDLNSSRGRSMVEKIRSGWTEMPLSLLDSILLADLLDKCRPARMGELRTAFKTACSARFEFGESGPSTFGL